MVVRYLLKVLTVFLVVSFGLTIEAQEKIAFKDLQEYFTKKYKDNDVISRANEGTISSLENSYCSEESYVDIVPDSWHPNTTSITWNIITYYGSQEYHPGWADVIGTGQETILRFYPGRVVEPYFGLEIYFEYIQKNSLGLQTDYNYDYTFVFKNPTAYDFGTSANECLTGSINLVLDGSETGMQYQLKKDGIDLGPFINGTGGPINFSVNEAGIYTVVARNSSENSCTTSMNGSITVHPLPTINIGSNSPVCEGETISLTADGGTTYSWTGPAGFTSLEQNPSIANATTDMAGSYQVTVISDKGCENTASTDVIVNTNPIVTITNPGAICENGNLTLTANVSSGTTPYTYQWYKGAAELTGETGFTLSLTNIQLSDAGTYRVVVSDAASCGPAEATTDVIVNQNPSITDITYTGDVCEGFSTSLSITASDGTTPYTYNWSLGGSPLTNNSGTLTLDPALVSQSGTYNVFVSDNNGCVSETKSQVVTVFANPVSDLTGPASICVGSTGVFDASASTGAITYTFYLDGGLVQSGASALYNYTPDAAATGSHSMRVVVTNADGCTDETTVNFTVYALPTATFSVDDAEVCDGTTVNLTVELTSGATPWSFDWSESGSSVSVPSGATYTQGFTPGVGTTDYTLISVTDNNGCTSTINQPISVVVNENPTVTITSSNAPTHQVCVGNDITLTATGASGNGSYVNYRWYKDGTLLTQGASNTYTITGAALADAGNYSVVVVDGEGCESAADDLDVTVTFATATLKGLSEFCAGTSVTYTAGGGDQYQFFVDGASVQALSPDNSYTTNLLTNGQVVSVRAVDANGCEDTESITVTVYSLPTATLSVDDAEVCNGTTVNLTVELTSGAQPWSFQWSESGSSVSVPSGATYTQGFTPAVGTTNYELISVSDNNGCTATINQTVSVVANENPTVTITSSNPSTHQVCVGNDITLTATGASGNGSYVNYRWYKDGTLLTQGASNTYTITGAALADAGNYSVVVVDGEGCESVADDLDVTVTFATATLTGLSEFCAGTSVTYTAGGGDQYQFFVDGASVQALSPDNTFNTNSLTNGQVVSVRVVDANGCEDTESITVTVYALPTATLSVDDAEVCEGTTVNLTVELTSGATPWSFDWSEGGVVSVASGVTYTEGFTPGVGTTDYTLISVTDNNGCTSTINQTVPVLVNANPTVTITSSRPSDQVCLGNDLTLTATGAGGGGSYVNYRWYKDGTLLSEGASDTYTITGAALADAGNYSVIVVDGKGCESAADDLDVTVTFATATLNATDTEICEGESITFNASVVGTTGGSYEFFINAGSVQGPSTNHIFTTNALTDGDVVSVRIVDENGCVDTDQLAITVNPLPVVTLASDVNNVCKGTSVVITATAGYDNYTFFVNGGEVQNGTSNTYTSTLFNDGDEISVQTTSTEGCSSFTGPVTMDINPLPTTTLALDNPTRTTVCVSEAVDFTASGADEYAFYVNGAEVQAKSAVNTFSYNSTDDFSVYVIGYNAFGCELQSNVIDVTISKPVAGLLVSPDKPEHCANETITFTGTGGVTYEFFYNGNSQGAGASDEYELFPPIDGDQVYVVVTDEFGCQATSETRTLIVNPTPDADLTSSDVDDKICEGQEITFTANEDASYTYHFFIIRDGSELKVQEGTLNTYTTTTLEDGDQVYVLVRDPNSCQSISPVIEVTVNPNPEVTLDVLPSNHIGEGESVQVVAGGADEYYFLLNGNPVGDWTTDDTWDFANPQNGDMVSVIGSFLVTGCSAEHPGITIQVDALPIEYELRALATEYCANEPGVQLYLVDYEELVDYMLIDISTGTEVEFGLGTLVGGVMTWNNVPAGTWFVRATRTTGIGTTRDFTTQITVTENPIPAVFNQLPNETISECYGGIDITLDGSEVDFLYILMLNSTTPVDTLTGDGSALAFESVYFSGTYTIVAQNPVTGCTNVMNGTTIVDALANSDIFNLYSVPASGHYCPGSTGVEIWLDGSEENVAYVLYHNSVQVGSTINGTGGPMLIATVSEEGVYMVMVAAQGGCIAPMNGTVTVVADPLPTAFTLSAENNGHFCPGGTGVTLSLSGQQNGVIYTLWRDGVELESVTGSIDDPTLPLEFTAVYNVTGEYMVTALLPGGCSGNMANTVTLVEDELPTAFEMEGDAGFCTGGSASIFLNGSQLDVDYELYLDGVATGINQLGNGGRLTFTVDQAGEYTIMGTFTTTVTGCSGLMTGSVVMTEIPYPDATLNVTGTPEGTDICDQGVRITIDNTETGVEYELFKYDGGLPAYTGNVLTGDGTTQSFATLVRDKAATYYVEARRGDCPIVLTDNVLVDVAGAIELFNITGNGDICVGDGGGTIGLTGSETDVDYALWRKGESVPIQTISGNGNALTFDILFDEGEYYVMGTSTNTGCSDRMLGEFVLKFNPLPIAFQMTGSGIYCGDVEGARIGLDGSEMDVNYKLVWHNGTYNQLMDEIDGSGQPLFFDGQFNEGDYTVYARNNLTGCTSSMNGTITVDQQDAPDITGITVDPLTDEYCSFDGGVELSLSGSEVDVTYTVFDETSDLEVLSVTRTETGSFVLGTVTAGTYRVEASRSGECAVEIASGILITELPSPTVFTLTAPSAGCASSIELNLDGSEVGVIYRLYSDAYQVNPEDDGFIPGQELSGTGEPLTFMLADFESGSSFFWVVATYFDGTTEGCSSETEWVEVDIRQAASPFELVLPDGNEYCADVPGVTIGVSSSDTGVGYQLIDAGGNTVDFLEGNGSERMFGLPHGAGTYFVRARHYESGCSFDSKDTTVIMHSMPAIFNLTPAGGSINDAPIILDGSEPGVAYYLYRNDVSMEQDPLAGDGFELNFGTVGIPGNYTVMAIGEGGCSSWMNGISHITEEPMRAYTDTLYLKKGQLIGEINVGDNDFFLSGIDVVGENVDFQLGTIQPLGEATLDAVTGLLVYSKLPTFYGTDSLSYIIKNTDFPTRIDSAKVYIMVGNEDFNDKMSFLLPNAFSPNDDTFNDKFVISGLGELEESSLEVFNRWGTVVYRSKGKKYENDWDGISNTGAMVSIGTELPNGTYYFIFKVKKNVEGKIETRDYNGFIELRR